MDETTPEQDVDPTLAIAIGVAYTDLQPLGRAISEAGYDFIVVRDARELENTPEAQRASVALCGRTGGDTAILAAYRLLRQRPALVTIGREGAMLAVGFDVAHPGPYGPTALASILRQRLPRPLLAPAEPVVSPPVITPPPSAPPPVTPTIVPSSPSSSETNPLPRIAVRSNDTPLGGTAAAPAAEAPPERSGQYLWFAGTAVLGLAVIIGLVLVINSFGQPTALPAVPTEPPTAEVVPPTATPPPPPTATPPPPTATRVPTATPLPAGPLLVTVIQEVRPAQPTVGDPVEILVSVTNITDRPTQPFWVDLYVAPRREPAPLLPWSDIADSGSTWRVEVLQPGETVTLSSFAADADRSNFVGFAQPGSYRVYVLGDTYNEAFGDVDSSGGVVESPINVVVK
jgi:hypothetical protein